MPILVLLGAGASFGSEPKHGSSTPPLGDHLFEELCKLGGVASKVPQDIKAVFATGFELGMALFNERMGVHLQAFHRELSSYLADFAPSPNSRYLQLLDLFRGRNVIFSSLNYDMMLEEAAMMRGMKVFYGINRHPEAIRILKPHGSINFWPDIPPDMISGVSFGGGVAAIEAPVRPLPREISKRYCSLHTSLSPAISMYAKGKMVPVCPNFVSMQQRFFSTACQKASKIIIIGVRVVAEDSHIWEPIQKSAAHVTYFGSAADGVEINEWSLTTGRKNVSFVNEYFDKAVSSIDPFD